MSDFGIEFPRQPWAAGTVRRPMLPHLAYYAALSSIETEERSTEWSVTAAGLIALRVVDRWIARSVPPASASEPFGGTPDTHEDLAPDVLAEVVGAAQRAVAVIEESSPYRALLARLVDASTSGATSELAAALFAYAHALHIEARWPLAADIYETIWHLTIAPGSVPRRALEALRPVALERLGHSRRMMGDLEGAADAYAQARAAAQAANDPVREARIEISEANLLIHLGNLPAAAVALDRIIAAAARLVEHPPAPASADLATFLVEDVPLADIRISPGDVLALARQDRGVVAARQGDLSAAIEHSFFAWRSYRGPVRRERAWFDLARALADLGLRDAARDAFLVLHVTARERETRWAATVNLLELAAIDGHEEAFASYRALLEDAGTQGTVPAWLWAWAAFFAGIGEARFGRPDRARAALQLALQLAERDRVNEILIRADAALSALDAGESPDLPVAPRVPVTPAVERIARLVRRARIRIAEPRTTSNPMSGFQSYSRGQTGTASLPEEKPAGVEWPEGFSTHCRR